MSQKHTAGQAMVEYALVLALVSLVAMAGLSTLGLSVSQVFTDLKNGISNAAVVAGSPLGATFGQISDAMIKLTQDFYQKNGRWPRSWGEFAYTDLGLKPDDWAKAYDGIIYKPGGDRVGIVPAEGYTFLVTDSNGKSMTLPSSYKWGLWYDMPTGTWRYHDQNGPVLQIKTLTVVPPKPK